MAKLDWHKARQRDAVGPSYGKPKRSRSTTKPKKPPGITNDQAKLLGQLCRKHGVPYIGQGMSRAQASTVILDLQATPDRWRTPKRGDGPRPIRPWKQTESPTDRQIAEITRLANELHRKVGVPPTRAQASVRITQLQAQLKRRRAKANRKGQGGHTRKTPSGKPRRGSTP